MKNWQPCNAKSVNPVSNKAWKISLIDLLAQIGDYANFGVYIIIFIGIN